MQAGFLLLGGERAAQRLARRVNAGISQLSNTRHPRIGITETRLHFIDDRFV